MTVLDVMIGLGLVWFFLRAWLNRRDQGRIESGEFRSSEIAKSFRVRR